MQTFDVLYVDRRPHVDAVIDEFFHVEIAFSVFTPGRVGMRKFVHKDQFGVRLDRAVHVELFQRNALIGNDFERKGIEPFRHSRRFWSVVRFEIADHHVHTLFFGFLRGFEHCVSFPCTRTIAEENF